MGERGKSQNKECERIWHRVVFDRIFVPSPFIPFVRGELCIRIDPWVDERNLAKSLGARF